MSALDLDALQANMVKTYAYHHGLTPEVALAASERGIEEALEAFEDPAHPDYALWHSNDPERPQSWSFHRVAIRYMAAAMVEAGAR
jgi:hypothetical protein